MVNREWYQEEVRKGFQDERNKKWPLDQSLRYTLKDFIAYDFCFLHFQPNTFSPYSFSLQL
jgi:hypothetical protein